MNKPEAIIFDWDNTLVDTWSLLLQSMNETFIIFGMTTWTLEEMKERCFRSMKDVFPQIFGNRWEEAGQLYRKTYRLNRAAELRFLPNALDFLDMVKYNNIYTAIVSNKASEILKEEVALLKVEEYFAKIIGSGDAPEDKPSPIPFQYALSDSNIQLSANVWYIGDTEGDMESAHNANCKQIFYGRDFNDTMKSNYPNVIYMENYRTLIKYFTNL
ncbi:MAG: HAD family hydrolase [Alphaproteobacteria bacterium]